MSRLVAVLLACLMSLAQAQPTRPAAQAQPIAPPQAPDAAADPALEARLLRIAAELRCLVCQNQTIADSNADLAVDLRKQVREMLQKGQTEAQIIDYMTARYGDFVLYRPPVKGATWLLWFGPAALMVIGVAIFLIVIRRRTRMAPEAFEPDPDDKL